jgi:hypothetical protein
MPSFCQRSGNFYHQRYRPSFKYYLIINNLYVILILLPKVVPESRERVLVRTFVSSTGLNLCKLLISVNGITFEYLILRSTYFSSICRHSDSLI